MKPLQFEMLVEYDRTTQHAVVVGKFPTRMTKTEALEASIQKWEFVVKSIKQAPDGMLVLDGGTDSCGLCQKFHLPATPNAPCSKCPVMQKTGFPGCIQTPYMEFSEVTNKLRYPIVGPNPKDPKRMKELRDARLREAKNELKFLRGLRKPTVRRTPLSK
jgi:hypothetical protein